MKKRISLSTLILLLIAAILLTAMSSCALADSYFRDENGDLVSGGESAVGGKLEQIINLFKTYSYYEIDEEVLCRAMVSGMGLAINDRYAEYYDAEEFALMTAENQGETQGIGVTVIENAEYKCIEIISVLPNSPALAAGVEPGDLIMYVGGGENKESVPELGYYAALAKLQGVKGTLCEFTVRRGEGYAEEVEFSIMRDTFTSESVMYHVCETNAKVGIIKITQFDLTTPPQFCAAMDALIAQGVEYFLFDVRYNGGGDLASITAVLSFMLNEDDILIKTRDRSGAEVVTKVAEVKYAPNSAYASCNVTKSDIAKYRDKVMGKSAVLANGSTASAAELFTCALMDYGISEIVGTTTYGKGSMQTIFSLEYFGFDGAVKMTTKMYFPPLSDGYDGIGIKPNLEVELDKSLENKNIYKITDAEDNQIQAAIDLIGK
ncbi:MAG: PDZ domain-containing protein [Clostridia bacterium]|nr:PDZ domain-containing protein [Clostridia bacterium]